MKSKPVLSETLHNNQRNCEKPEQMTSKKRVLYELETVLGMKDKDLSLEALNKTSGRVTVSTRCLYKIYKAVLEEKDLQPSMIYTGKGTLEFDEAKRISENTDKELKDFEVTI